MGLKCSIDDLGIDVSIIIRLTITLNHYRYSLMKKPILLFVASLIVSLILAGCGGGETADEKAANEAAGDAKKAEAGMTADLNKAAAESEAKAKEMAAEAEARAKEMAEKAEAEARKAAEQLNR